MIRVEVPDATRAKTLVHRLADVLDPTAVLLDADRGEVRVEENGASNQIVAQVLGTIEDWLEQTDIHSATVWLDDSQYTLRQATTIASRQ